MQLKCAAMEDIGVIWSKAESGLIDLPIGKGQSIRGKNGTVSMDQNGLYTQKTGNFACVLATCSTETCKSDEKKLSH